MKWMRIGAAAALLLAGWADAEPPQQEAREELLDALASHATMPIQLPVMPDRDSIDPATGKPASGDAKAESPRKGTETRGSQRDERQGGSSISSGSSSSSSGGSGSSGSGGSGGSGSGGGGGQGGSGSGGHGR